MLSLADSGGWVHATEQEIAERTAALLDEIAGGAVGLHALEGAAPTLLLGWSFNHPFQGGYPIDKLLPFRRIAHTSRDDSHATRRGLRAVHPTGPHLGDVPHAAGARLDPAEIDRLFEENATRQYTREVLFSAMVELMGVVVCGAQPSVRAAYLASLGEIAASLTASTRS